jgi:hypothetical protein
MFNFKCDNCIGGNEIEQVVITKLTDIKQMVELSTGPLINTQYICANCGIDIPNVGDYLIVDKV